MRGGLVLPGHRQVSASGRYHSVPVPARLVLPLQQHIGTPARPCVRLGQQVARGERIAEPDSYVSMALHAPAAGRVVGIGPEPVAHPGGLSLPCIVIETDPGGTASSGFEPLQWRHCEPVELQQRIAEAGIVGLGGAGFPAAVKLREGSGNGVDLLVINGVECEPWITCDDTLLRCRADAVVEGALILARAAAAPRLVLAVEADMPEAVAALTAAVAAVADDGAVALEIRTVPAVYPAGGEKQLILALTGEEVPSGGLPIQVGVVMHNVATAAAVADAVCRGEPLLTRLVTVTGEVERPGNYLVPLGMAVADLLAHTGPRAGTGTIMGGPMMGVALASTAVPITRVSNCLLVVADTPARPAQPCIRCGRCVEVCPAGLDAQGLYEFCRVDDYDAAQDYHLFDCIECGLCAYVCPSAIPLVQYYRHAKADIEVLDEAAQRASDARERHERRAARLAAPRPAVVTRDSAAVEPAPAVADRRSYIAEAVARERARRRSADD